MALYIAAAAFAAGAVFAVYGRCKWTNSAKKLEKGWVGRTATHAAPMPVFVLLLLSPLDGDLVKVMMKDFIIVALAGLYGLSETINDLRSVAGRAREKAESSP
jgi:hypothetical protein